MGKRIDFTQSELTWITYSCSWNEHDFNKWKKLLLTRSGDTNSYAQYNKTIYEAIKDMTWDEMVTEYQKYKSSQALILKQVRFVVDYGAYEQSVGSLLEEAMSGDAYNSDPIYGESLEGEFDYEIEDEGE